MNFTKNFRDFDVPAGKVAIFWLGQAGFLLKTASGRTIAIDPYFSDYVFHSEKDLGFKRLTPPLCEANEIIFDALLISHEHGDHFDAEAIFQMMENGKTQIYTSITVAERMQAMSLDMNRVHVLRKGERTDLPDCSLTAVDCDHGSLAPEALGFLLDFGFGHIYYAGDTALNYARLSVPLEMKPEVAILPINGAFGNLDGEQAAEYAGKLGCKICVPCHFWTFPRHYGSPQQMIDAIGEKAPQCELKLLCQGEGFLV